MNNVIIKAFKAKSKNPSSNLRLFVSCLLILLCVPYVLADNTYTWTMASGDLGTNNTTNPTVLCVPATSVTKGSPSTTWSAEWTWKDADNRYMGWDSNSRGIQIGKSNYGNGNQLVLYTSGITGTISNVTVNSAVASSGAATITVSVGSATFKYNNNNSASVNSTSSANFAFTGNASGTITITLSSTADKAMFIKSISVTYSASSKTNLSLSLDYTSTSLTACGSDSSNPTLTGNSGNGTVTWQSSNEAVATVSNTGVVSPVAEGTARITASVAETTNYNAGSVYKDFSISAASARTVTWYVEGASSSTSSVVPGNQATPPSDPSSSCSGEFVGWVAADDAVVGDKPSDNNTTAPSTIYTSSNKPLITCDGNVDFHAVFKKQ